MESDDNRTIIYTGQSLLSRPLALLGGVVKDVVASRELTWTLFQRDLKAQVRQSFLGYAWLIIPPLFQSFVWILINNQGMIDPGTEVGAYGYYVLLGTTLWSGFTAAVLAPIAVFKQNKTVFIKLKVPLEAFVTAALVRVTFNVAVIFALSLILISVTGGPFHGTWILLPISVITTILTGAAIGLMLSPIGMLYQDIEYGLTPVISILMFLSPVVFSIPENESLIRSVMLFNPTTPPLLLARESILNGSYDSLIPCLLVFAVFTFAFIAFFAVLRVSWPHIVARVGM